MCWSKGPANEESASNCASEYITEIYTLGIIRHPVVIIIVEILVHVGDTVKSDLLRHVRGPSRVSIMIHPLLHGHERLVVRGTIIQLLECRGKTCHLVLSRLYRSGTVTFGT